MTLGMSGFMKWQACRTGALVLLGPGAWLLIPLGVGLYGQALNLAPQTAGASFEQDGRVRLPADYREWVHVGTRYKVGGTNILDGTPVKIPQVLNTYVETSALAFYKLKGKWPDGAQIAKELSQVKGGANCDSTTFICSTPLGSGIFQESYIGVGMMVKDRARFPADPGNWGYFAFFHKASGYDKTASKRPADQCASCHVKLASDTDYVITNAHLGLLPGRIQTPRR
jgi:hypothetical protein